MQEKGAEWSVLSFHYSAHEAKVQASKQWLTEFRYLALRARKANDNYMIFAESDEPHVVDTWGNNLDKSLTEYATWEDALNVKLNED